MDLAALDAFEGPDYQRTAVTVTSASGEFPAVAWRYTAKLPDGAEPVPDGDFAAWLVETGRSAFVP